MPEQGMFRLASSGEGYITKVKVREGQSVEAGDVLFVLSGERISTTGSIHNFISEQLDQRQLLLERNRALVDDRSHDQLSILNVRARTIDEEQARLSEEVYLLEWRIDLLRTNLSVSNNW